MAYIKKQEAFRKMKEAEDNFRPVIILANAGWGKTVLVENYFKRRSFLLLSGESGALNKMPDIGKIRQGAVVIDVGMNPNADGKLCGAVDFAAVEPVASMITPVPGGVGPMTITMLLKNTLTAAKSFCERKG